MGETPLNASKAALHEYIEANITVDGLETPGQETTLHATLEHLSGVQSLGIAGRKVTVDYEPIRITKAQLLKAIQAAGFRISEVEAGPASPLTDAFAGKAKALADDEASPVQRKTIS